MARMNNWWMGVKNWLKASGTSAKRRSISHRRWIGLEILEERAVPAIITVTNLLDGTNPTSPLPGSLREAVKVLAKPGDEIHFDQALFASGTPQTLTLNGAVGALQIEQNNITIVGPGKFTTGPNIGTYQLTLKADLGFQDTIQVLNKGVGYRVGDLLQQGSTLYKGAARFQVLTVDSTGGVTEIRVVNPGANTGFTGNLSESLTGLNNLAPVGAVTGTGLILKPSAGNLGLASGLIFSQLVTANPQNFAVSGLHFGDSKSAAVYQNLGNLSVNDCLFDSPVEPTGDQQTDPFGTQVFIQTSNYSGKINISNSIFDSTISGVWNHVQQNGNGDIVILNSKFTKGHGQVSFNSGGSISIINSEFSLASNYATNPPQSGFAFKGTGSSLTITDSKFHDGTNGVIFNSGGKATVDNSYFYKTTNGGLTLNGPSTRVTNSFFSNNTRAISGGSSQGGAAIWATAGSLTLRKSIFSDNKIQGIRNFNCGGGAVFNFDGPLTVDGCSFTGNYISVTGFPDPSDPLFNFAPNPELMPSPANSGGGALYSGGSTKITNSYFTQNEMTSTVDFWASTVIQDDGTSAPSRPQFAGGGAIYITSNGGQTTSYELSNLTATENAVRQTGSITNPHVGAGVNAITSEDFDRDGIPDLIIGTTLDANNIEYWKGVGFGQYLKQQLNYSVVAPIRGMAAGDFNNDGNQDFVCVSYSNNNNVSVFYGTGSGAFTQRNFTLGDNLTCVVAGDLNGVGGTDLVIGRDADNSNIYTVIDNGFKGAASISATNSKGRGKVTSVGLGNAFSSSVRPDLVVGLNQTEENVAVLRNNNGTGSFVGTKFSTAGGSPIVGVGIGRFSSKSANGDIVAINADSSSNVQVYLDYDNFNPLRNTTKWSASTGGSDKSSAIIVGDFDNDNFDDIAIVQKRARDNAIVGVSGGTGVFTFYTGTAGNTPKAITKVPYLNGNSTLAVGCLDIQNNIQVSINSASSSWSSFVGSTNKKQTSGSGLTGGAIMIAAGVDATVANIIQERPFTGITKGSITNCTITNNELVNPYALVGQAPLLNSNARSGPLFLNRTDTGGVFVNTPSSSETKVINTLLARNIGNVYTTSGSGKVGYSNSGKRFSDSNSAPGSFASLGHNLYGADSTFGFYAPNSGDLPRSDSAPVFDLYGLADNLGPTIGLIKPQPALPNQGQGKILTMALDRLSPARDAGSDSVFSSGSPVQLNYDGRGVLRKINLAVDIGAYEVQTGTATVVGNPKLQPADFTHPNPYFVTNYGLTTDITVAVQWNDVLPPSGVISGTVQLVSQADPTQVIATGTVVGDPNDVNAGGLASISLNVAGLPPTLLNTGLNNFLLIYSGDPTWAPSQSNPFSVEVIPSTTTTTLLSGSPPAQIPNGLVNFSGTVSANSIIIPQGPIVLRARKLPGGGYPIGSWSDIATGTLDPLGNFSFSNVKFATPGNYEVQAIYSSTTPSQFTSSTSTSVVQEIGYYFTAAAPFSAFSVDLITRAGTPVSTVERGDSVTLKATARFNAADGLPLGTVQFLTPAGTVIGSGTGNLVAPGQMEYTLANIDPTMLPLGSSQIIASYTRQWTTAGDPYLSMNTLNSQPLTITSIATTTSLTAAPASLIYGNNLLLTATVSPTKAGVNYKPGTIDFYSGTLKLASVPVTGNSPTATLDTNTLAPGNYSITAVYSGDGLNYSAATSAARSVVVNKAATTLGISVTPPATVTIPNQVTITASLTNNAGPGAAKPSGLIYLYRNGVTLANWDLSQSGTPTFTDTPYVAGNYTYELRYTGDVNYQAASPVSQVVQAIVSPVTTTTLQVSANSTVYGTPLVFTANVAPAAGVAYQPGRKVKFEAWNGPTLVNLGESTLGLNTNGWPLPVEITSSALPAGNWDIKALYEGDGAGGYYLPSTSVPVPLTVTKAATSLSLAITGTYVDGRSAVPFTMTLKNDAQVPSLNPSGTITVTANGNTIRTLPVTPGLTTYTVSDWIPGTAGTFNLVASYSGDNNYQTAVATGQVTTYLKTNTQTGVTVVPASTTYGNSVLLTANVTPAGLPAGGQVQFYVNGVALGAAQTLDANQKASLTTTTLDVGAQSITAKYLGRPPEYLESISAPAVVTVAKAATSMTLIPSGDLIPTGTPVTLTATLSESVSSPALDPVGNIEFWVDGVSMGSAPIIKGVATYTVTPQIPKTYLYEAKYAGSGTYLASAASTKVTAYQGALEKYYVVAPQVGSGLYIYDRVTNRQNAVLYPLGPSYSGGFTVTRGDINGDGVSDIVFSGRNTGLVQAIDGNDFTLIGSASPFGAAARFPLSIAVGDVNGDGKGDLIAAPAGIGMPPHVVAISGKDFRKTLFSQYAYSAQFRGGVSVAAGEVNGDGVADIITAPLVGAPPHIVTFNGASGKVLQSYYAYSQQYMGGTSIVASDLDNDGFVEIITGASAAAPHIVIVDSRTQKVKASFYAFEPGFAGGLRVSAVQDINGDGIKDILVAPGAGAPPNILRLDGKKALQNQSVVLDSFFAYGFADPSTNYYGGAFVG